MAEHVIVELDVRAGLPAFSVIGMAVGAARDARERVQAAVLNSGLAVPRKRVTIPPAPLWMAAPQVERYLYGESRGHGLRNRRDRLPAGRRQSHLPDDGCCLGIRVPTGGLHQR